MKKFLIIFVAVIFATTVYADGYKTCKIPGTTGSVVVSVYEKDTEKGIATVQFSNDTDTPANVSAIIMFNDNTKRSITKRVPAQCEVSVDISRGKSYTSVVVSEVSGEKCQK